MRTIVEYSDPVEHLFIKTITQIEYQDKLSKVDDNIPTQYKPNQEGILRNLSLCGKYFLCKKKSIRGHTVYTTTNKDEHTFIPKILVSEIIPIEVAIKKFPEYFV